MGGSRPRLDVVGTLTMARKARMGGGAYHVQRGVRMPRSKVKALVGSKGVRRGRGSKRRGSDQDGHQNFQEYGVRIVRASKDTSAMLQGAGRRR